MLQNTDRTERDKRIQALGPLCQMTRPDTFTTLNAYAKDQILSTQDEFDFVWNYYKIQLNFRSGQERFSLNLDRVEEAKEEFQMDDKKILQRITVNPHIFGGKPIIRGHRRGSRTRASNARCRRQRGIHCWKGIPGWSPRYTGLSALCP